MTQTMRSNEFLEHAMKQWGDTVLRLALNQTRNTSDAEDVFQDVFLRLLKDNTHFKDAEHLKAWLLRVTINRCRDLGRMSWKRRNEPLEERHAAIAAPELFSSELWETVGNLPFDLQTVIHLFYVEGYSTDEISRITECPSSTVRTRLHRARAHLKKTFGSDIPERNELAAIIKQAPDHSQAYILKPAHTTPDNLAPQACHLAPPRKEGDHEQRSSYRPCLEHAKSQSIREIT